MRTISPAEYQRSREERETEYWTSLAGFTDAGTVIAETPEGRSLYRFDATRPVSTARPQFRGFSGSRWQVRFLDGREVITNDLYGNGVIPERFRHLFTVNAELELLEARPSS